ncbi:hypothetical protein DL96DRAFT_1625923 [Flagelloscypha sp. PMI_526]|nr:hypothetical protein DL96DRAFT_1625923 [Flagelloscypha sp. PMI_526]
MNALDDNARVSATLVDSSEGTENWENDFDFTTKAASLPGPATAHEEEEENWDSAFTESSPSPTKRRRTLLQEDEHENWDDSFEYSPPTSPSAQGRVAVAKQQQQMAEFGLDDEDDSDDDEDKTVTTKRRNHFNHHDLPPPPLPIPTNLPPSPRASLFTPSVLSHGSSGHDSTTHLFHTSSPRKLLAPIPPPQQKERERRRLRKKSRPTTVFEMKSMPESSDNLPSTEDEPPMSPTHPDGPMHPPITPEPPSQPPSVPQTPSKSPPTGGLLSRGLGSVKRKLGRAAKKRISSTPSESALAEAEDIDPELSNALAAIPSTSSSPPQKQWFFRSTPSQSSISPPSAQTTGGDRDAGPSIDSNAPPPTTPSKLIKRKSFGFVPIRASRQLPQRQHQPSQEEFPVVDDESRKYGALGIGWSPHRRHNNNGKSSSRSSSRNPSASTVLGSGSALANGSVEDFAVRERRTSKSRSRSRAGASALDSSDGETGTSSAGLGQRIIDGVRRISFTGSQRPKHIRKDSNVSMSSRPRTPSFFSGGAERPRTPSFFSGGAGGGGERPRTPSLFSDRPATQPQQIRRDPSSDADAEADDELVSSSSEQDHDSRSHRHLKDRTIRRGGITPSPNATPRRRRTRTPTRKEHQKDLEAMNGAGASPPPPLPLPKGAAPPQLGNSSSTSLVSMPTSSAATPATAPTPPLSPAKARLVSPSPSYPGGGGGSLGRSNNVATPRPSNSNLVQSALPATASPGKGRRNSLNDLKAGAGGSGGGELKIPARISQAQSGLKRDLGMVKEFAGEVDRLKALQTDFIDLTRRVQGLLDGYSRASSSASTSSNNHINNGQPRSTASAHKHLFSEFVTINSKYRITWECAELLIELGGAGSSSSASGADTPHSTSDGLGPVKSSTSAPTALTLVGRERAITLTGEGSRSSSPALFLANVANGTSSNNTNNGIPSSTSTSNPSSATGSVFTKPTSSIGMGMTKESGWRASTGRHDLSSRQLALLKEILGSPTQAASSSHYHPASSTMSVATSPTPASAHAAVQLFEPTNSSSSTPPYYPAHPLVQERSTSALSFVVNRDWKWGGGGYGDLGAGFGAGGFGVVDPNAMNSTITLPGTESSHASYLPHSPNGNGKEGKKRGSRLMGMSGFRDMLKALKSSGGGSSSKKGLDERGLPKEKEKEGTFGRRRAKTSSGVLSTHTTSNANANLNPTPWDSVRSFQSQTPSQRATSPLDSVSSFKAGNAKSPKRPSLASIFKMEKRKASSKSSSAAGNSTTPSSSTTEDEEDWDRMDDFRPPPQPQSVPLETPISGHHLLPSSGSDTIRGGTSPYLAFHQNAVKASGSKTSLGSHNPPENVPPRATRLSNVQELDMDFEEGSDLKTPTRTNGKERSKVMKRPGSSCGDPSSGATPEFLSATTARSTSYTNGNSSTINGSGGPGSRTGSVRSMPPTSTASSSVLPPGRPSDILAMTPENIRPLLENAKEVSRRLVVCIGEVRGLLEVEGRRDEEQQDLSGDLSLEVGEGVGIAR